jgi:selenoprotein W-related protein
VVDLLKLYEAEIESLTLIPSSAGKFEVMVDRNLIYSKLSTGRHAESGEVVRLFEQFIHGGAR